MDNFPIYLKGLLALFFIFVLPGLLVVRALKVDDFPQRWFAVFLSSLLINHFTVTIIALLGVKPIEIYNAMVLCFLVALIVLEVRRPNKFARAASEVRSSDVFWLLISLIVVAVTYLDVWRHGVPNAFDDGDVSLSWIRWTLAWADGLFPIGSAGYPQFVPTIWATTYILTGSKVQYFAFYCYVILIVTPLIFNALVLGRLHWWLPVVQGFVFFWFVAEIREPWLRSTLPQGYPDWIVVVFSFAGAMAFLSQRPPHQRSFSVLLLALFLECIAAATKPIYFLFVVTFALAICVDALRNSADRKLGIRIVLSVVYLVSVFVIAYGVNYTHVGWHGTPPYYIADRFERLSHAWSLFASTFSIPFRLLCLSGFILSLLLPRARWLALPLWVGVAIWADKSSYDLRNCLGLILIAAVIPVDALARRYARGDIGAFGRKWVLKDTTIALGALVALFLLSLPVAEGDKRLEEQFAANQLRLGPGQLHNEAVAKDLRAGCALFSTSGYYRTVLSLEAYKPQMHFFYPTLPINDDLRRDFEGLSGCTAVLFPPDRTIPSLFTFLESYFHQHHLRKVGEGGGMELWSSNSEGR